MRRRLNITTTLFITLLLIGLWLRLYRLPQNYDVAQGDVARDYLVAHHIVADKEYPTLGPWNSVYTSLRNSPLYYYFLAAFLLIKDDIYTLGVVNVVLQMISIGALFALANILFGIAPAMLVGTMLVVNPQFLNQADIMWQPHATMPFYYASYALLAWGFTRKSFAATCFAGLVYVWSLGMGFYGVPTLPGFVVLAGLTLKRIGAGPVKSTTLFACMAFLGLVLYASVFQDVLRGGQQLSLVNEDVYVRSLSQYLGNFVSNIVILFNGFLYKYDSGLAPQWVRGMVQTALIAFLVYYLVSNKTKRAGYVWALTAFTLQLLVIASLLKGVVYDHYFVAGVGPLVVAVSEAVIDALKRRGVAAAASALTIVCALPFVTPSVGNLRWRLLENNVYQSHAQAVRSVVNALPQIRVRYTQDWQYRFQIVVYIKEDGETASDSIFWVPLEKELGTKLTRVQNEGRSFAPIGSNDYVFLVCMDYERLAESQDQCAGYFLSRHPLHREKETIYQNGRYIIYLLEKHPMTIEAG